MKKFQNDFGVYCCPHVFKNERPALLVVRDSEGDWQFFCGERDDTDTCHHIGVGSLLDCDPSLQEMSGLSVASGAERDDSADKWRYFELEVE